MKRLVLKGDNVEFAEVFDLMHWRRIEIHAQTFVVAAGTVMSAQLLWASGLRDHKALGRWMIEHPIAFTQIVLKKKIIDAIKSDQRFKLEESNDLEGSNDPVPIPMHDPPPNVWIPISKEREWHCQIHKDAFHYGALPADVDDRLIVDLRWFAIIDPQFDNRVTFEADIFNEFGMPQPTFEFKYGESDAMRMHNMMTDMIGAAQALGGILPGAEPRIMPSGLCLHIQGTCRMGERDNGESVVDSNSKVWGIDNLYVAGNSIIPTANGSNPTLTNVALAIKGVGSIIGKKVSVDETNATSFA